MESSPVIKSKKGKSKSKKIMVMLLPEFDDPLHDSDGMEWNVLFFILKNLGFDELYTVFQLHKGEELLFKQKEFNIDKKEHPFASKTRL
ncbi:hypothetical protein ACFL35_02385 [Candidatus Riflebacteria bacterium]